MLPIFFWDVPPLWLFDGQKIFVVVVVVVVVVFEGGWCTFAS
jgi:hypothetical protein